MYIGLHGGMCSGKDTLADYLVSEYGFYKIAFGDVMKEALALVFGHVGLTADPYVKDVKMRRLLQRFATEAMRDYDPDIWIRPTLGRALTQSYSPHVVFTDVRFPNERDAISLHSGTVVKLWCEQTELAKRRRAKFPDYDASTYAHQSEQVLDGIVTTIDTTDKLSMQAGTDKLIRLLRAVRV